MARGVWKSALGGCAGPGVGVVDLALVSALEGQNGEQDNFPMRLVRTKWKKLA